MVGHTGNSVDQTFSILTQEFKKSEIKTLEELEKLIVNSPMSPKPEVERLQFVWDWKYFMTDNFADKSLSNHSFYNGFCIKKEGGITRLRVKRLPQDQVWFPPTGIELIKRNIDYQPVGSADSRVESLNLDRVLSDLTKYFQRMPTHVRISISDSWYKLKETLEGLPKKQKNLPKMRITDLPKLSLTTPEVRLPDE